MPRGEGPEALVLDPRTLFRPVYTREDESFDRQNPSLGAVAASRPQMNQKILRLAGT